METAVYPENIEDCYKVIDHVSTERDHYKALYEQLQRYRYGQRSEKLSQGQLDLFAEFLDENAEKESQQEAITVPAHQRQRPKRKPLPEHLPRERIEHDLTEGDKVCACGCAMQRIGEEIRKRRYLGRYFAHPMMQNRRAKRDDYKSSAVRVTQRYVP
ncbi:transposase [Piscirickettsia salmonis]|uniref:transposase n=1 Tax=Piscirickettsia salmonis TaxID=1238 RepID=UPI0018ACD56A|nr:transposase [Piscirickettsia salmonis]